MAILRSARSGAVRDPARLTMLEGAHALGRPTFTYSGAVVSGTHGE